MMKNKITVSTDKVGSEVSKVIDIDEYELHGMTASELSLYVEEYVSDEVDSMYYSDWEVVK